MRFKVSGLTPLHLATFCLGLWPWGKLFFTDHLSSFDFLSAGTASLLVVFFSVFTLRMYRYWSQEKSAPAIFGFLTLSIIVLSLLFLEWPGFVNQDDILLNAHVKTDGVMDWFSLIYSMLCGALLLFFREPFYLSLLDFFLYLILLSQLFAMTRWKWRSSLYWLFLLIFLLPQTYLLVLQQSRDSLFSLLLLIFAFGLLQKKIAPQAQFQIKPMEIAFIGLVLGGLRYDGLSISLFTPILLFYFCSWDKKTLVRSAALVIAGGFLLFFVAPKVVSYEPFTREYRLTAYVNPLSFVVNRRGAEAFTLEQKQKIDRVINFEYLITKHSAYEIDPYHQGGVRHPLGEEDFENFQITAKQILKENLDLLLENRGKMSMRLFHLSGGSDFGMDHLRAPVKPELLGFMRTLEADPKPEQKNFMQSAHYSWLVWVLSPERSFLKILLSGFVPLLAVLLLPLFLRSFPAFSVVALIFLSRAVVVGLFTPAPYFKYIAAVWVGGWLLLILFLQHRNVAEYKGPKA